MINPASLAVLVSRFHSPGRETAERQIPRPCQISGPGTSTLLGSLLAPLDSTRPRFLAGCRVKALGAMTSVRPSVGLFHKGASLLNSTGNLKGPAFPRVTPSFNPNEQAAATGLNSDLCGPNAARPISLSHAPGTNQPTASPARPLQIGGELRRWL